MWQWIRELHLSTHFHEVMTFLKVFVRHPINATRKLPEWRLETTIFLVVLSSAFSALLTGIMARSLVPLISGLLLVPLMSLIFLGVGTVVYHYVFIFLYDRSVDKRKIFQVLAVSSLPFLVFRCVGFWISPILLIGMAFSCVLMVVGFVDNFYLPKRSVMKLVGLIFCVLLFQWVYTTIKSTSRITDYRDRISDDSMRVLDNEFKKDQDQDQD
jgi:hypothetical protein